MAARTTALTVARRPGDLILDGLAWLDQARPEAPASAAPALSRIHRSATDVAAVWPPNDTEHAAAVAIAAAYRLVIRHTQIPAGARARYTASLEEGLALVADRMDLIMETLAKARSAGVADLGDRVRAMPPYEPAPAPAPASAPVAPQPNPAPRGPDWLIPAVAIVAALLAVLAFTVTVRSCDGPTPAHALPAITWSPR